MRLTKRISSRDDSELARVSLDLMDDPDIQNFVKKSYSLEDVSQLPMDDEDDDNPFVSSIAVFIIRYYVLLINFLHYQRFVDDCA